jgi:hypothetical protein
LFCYGGASLGWADQQLLAGADTVVDAKPVGQHAREDTFERIDRRRFPYFDPNIIGLTSSKETVDKVVKACGANYETDRCPEDEPDAYSGEPLCLHLPDQSAREVGLLYDYETAEGPQADGGRHRKSVE